MKKIIIVMALSMVLTGCNSNNFSTGAVSKESNQLEAPPMTYDDYVQFLDKDFKNDDWLLGVDESEERLMLIYDKYYLDLHKAKQYTDSDKFKDEWIDFTNTVYKTTRKYCEKLAELGFEGEFAMGIQDSYGEIMYFSMEGKWQDNVFETQGTEER